MRTVEADRQEERLLLFREGLEPLDGPGSGAAVGLLGVGAVGGQPADRAPELPGHERKDQSLVIHVAALGIEDRVPAGGIIQAVGADLLGNAVVVELADPLDLKARVTKRLRQRDGVGDRLAKVPGVVANGGRGGPPAGEQARAAGVAERKLAVGPLEPHASGRQPIDARRLCRLVAIRPQRTAQVVADHEQDVSRRGRRFGRHRGPDQAAAGGDDREARPTHRSSSAITAA